MLSREESVITVKISFNGKKHLEKEQIAELGSGESLRDVILEEGFEFIAPYAFMECTDLKTIVLPSSLKQIGEGAFLGCSNLTTVMVHGDTESAVKGVHLPDELEAIGKNAFRRCDKIKGELILPEGFRSMGESAFEDSRFGKFYFPGTMESIGLSAFTWWNAETAIYVQDRMKILDDVIWAFMCRAKPSRPILVSNASAMNVVKDVTRTIIALDEALIGQDGAAYVSLLPDDGARYLLGGLSADQYVASLYHLGDENNQSLASCSHFWEPSEQVAWCGDLSDYEALRKHLEKVLGTQLGDRTMHCVFSIGRFIGGAKEVSWPRFYLYDPDTPRKILPLRDEDVEFIQDTLYDDTIIEEWYWLNEWIEKGRV